MSYFKMPLCEFVLKARYLIKTDCESSGNLGCREGSSPENEPGSSYFKGLVT